MVICYRKQIECYKLKLSCITKYNFCHLRDELVGNCYLTARWRDSRCISGCLRWMVPVFRTREVWWWPPPHARDLSARFKIQKKKNKYGGTKIFTYQVFFSCLSEIGSKQKLSFERQLLSNTVCVRKTLFVAQCPKFKARVSISVAINLVGDRDQ